MKHNMLTENIKIAMIAGESSGDFLGAHLIKTLQHFQPKSHFFGIGGPLMIAEGFKSYFNQEDLAVRGYFEIIKSLPKILSIRKQIINIILNLQPDIFIGIDSPDFNFTVERKTHQKNIPTIHYVSPSVWAWKTKRIDKIIQFTDDILCLFPIEPPIYHHQGGHATYVGHPLAQQIPLEINQKDSRKKLKIAKDTVLITMMPGSRKNELEYMTPVFLKTAELLFNEYDKIQLVIPTVNQNGQNKIKAIIQQMNLDFLNIELIDAKLKHEFIAASNVTLVTSGTATLEVALCKCPMVISYIISPLTYHLVKPFIKTPYIGLPNILLGYEIVPELIQTAATAENLFKACQRWIEETEDKPSLITAFTKLHSSLRQNTSELAVQAILKIIKPSSC